MKAAIASVTSILALAVTLQAAEYHVAIKGKNSNTGTQDAPFCTIQHAADLAQPGDTITVHEGVYRERINPPRGGRSPDQRITYQAATGEKVELKGSEVIKNWTKVQNETWKVVLPNTFFGSFNPFQDLIKGDWFNPKGRDHHTGAVYLNGDWLTEAAKLDEVMKPIGDTPLWFGQVDKENTTIWAQFKGSPNEQQVEINARQAIFYPDKPGRDYITVRGFIMRHAATPWAPPTAEQIGLIGTHWSKGWIIENNVISHSVCTGITLGKHGDQYDNTSADTAEGYVKTIERAQKTGYDKLTTEQLNKSVQDSVGKMQRSGWSKETIGHHVVRDNTISHCEQAGIVGSLGAIFSKVSGNTIHDIHVRRLFTGAEQAGIKFHAAIDVEISRNHIYRTSRGLWLDWMAQGTRVTSNLLHDNQNEDVFVEVDHGPFLLDNNILLSKTSVRDMSQGGAYAHNLMAGHVKLQPDKKRLTPFHKAHSTGIAGLKTIVGGDDRFYNNIFVGSVGLSEYDDAKLPVWMDGNVFFNGAKPSKFETNPLVKTDFDPAIKLTEKTDGFYMEMNPGPLLADERTRKLVTTELLGKAAIPDVPYEQPDGTPIRVATDYFGGKRQESNPMPGPFESLGKAPSTSSSWRVWPHAQTQPAQDLGLSDQADFGRVVNVGSANKEDEFPTIGSDDDGNIWVCWVAYDGNADAVLAAKIDGQTASPPVVLSETTGDHWLPAMCKDGQGRLWATWARGVQGKWDIWGKYLSGGKWSDTIRLTHADGNDFCQKLAVDKAGTLWMTWQSVVDGNYEIMLTTITPEGPGKLLNISRNPASDWEPAIAATKDGRVLVAWDSYRGGSYDILLVELKDGQLSEPIGIATSPAYEAHAALAVDHQDRLWVAWDNGGIRWGQDNEEGRKLHSQRSVEIRCLHQGQLAEPAEPLSVALSGPFADFCELPELSVDAGGSLWLFVRHLTDLTPKQLRPDGRHAQDRGMWNPYVLHYDGKRWSRPQQLPRSNGRNDMRVCTSLDRDGRTWAAWADDGRTKAKPPEPRNHNVHAAPFTIPSSNKVVLETRITGQVQSVPQTQDQSASASARHKLNVGGREYMLAFGDTHRHTDISQCGMNRDGSLMDTYRYAIDVAKLDFLAITDHDQDILKHRGGGRAKNPLPNYIWWRSEKYCDLFHIENKFIPLYAYEHGRPFAQGGGHKNVLYLERGQPCHAQNSPGELFKALKGTNAVVIPHQLADGQSAVDWSKWNPEFEKVAEVFQARGSYEYQGALPKVRVNRDGNYYRDALMKGVIIGAIASSDHGMVHSAYAGVYCNELSRAGVMEGLSSRRTFGSMDRMAIEFRLGDRLLGQEVEITTPPTFDVLIEASKPLRKIQIVKNGSLAHEVNPGTLTCRFDYVDQDIKPGQKAWYYVRCEQDNDRYGWSSPIWVERKPDGV